MLSGALAGIPVVMVYSALFLRQSGKTGAMVKECAT